MVMTSSRYCGAAQDGRGVKLAAQCFARIPVLCGGEQPLPLRSGRGSVTERGVRLPWYCNFHVDIYENSKCSTARRPAVICCDGAITASRFHNFESGGRGARFYADFHRGRQSSPGRPFREGNSGAGLLSGGVHRWLNG